MKELAHVSAHICDLFPSPGVPHVPDPSLDAAPDRSVRPGAFSVAHTTQLISRTSIAVDIYKTHT